MDNSKIFNRALLRKRRNRAAKDWTEYNFLKKEAVNRMVDSLLDIARPFSFVLDIGSHKGELAAVLGEKSRIITCDIAEEMHPQVVCDEEFLPFKGNTFDLVASTLSLHHVNDLPGSLIQIRDILKPDGLFIAIVPGANTLIELRNAITNVSAGHGFPLSPRISPFVEVRDAGALLQRAGFALPVVGSETITVNYDSAFDLMKDLHGMGESNILIEQHKHFIPRAQMAAICSYYDSHYADENGGIRATIELITMTGWKPHASQQQSAERGSGKINLKKFFGG